jgi:tryptophanyl-tRNA synthetase
MLSGIAATGRLHIGNYIGAIQTWVRRQDDFDCFFFIADMHALTIPESVRADELRSKVREIVGLYLSCGIDPHRSTIFLQSHVPAHAELAWIFQCVTPMSWLQRMTQYKSKSERTSASAGLFTYPVLQAADILLYQPKYVPVGADQRQHVEITRDIAQRFNSLFGECFAEPEALIPETGARVMGLDDPTEKMSKSLAELREGHAIRLLDPPEKIRRTIMRAKTDSGSAVSAENISPAIDNLLSLYEALTQTTREDALKEFDQRGYGVLKNALLEVVLDAVGKIRAKYDEVTSDPEYLDGVLAEGAARAAAVANGTLRTAKDLVGLIPPRGAGEVPAG